MKLSVCLFSVLALGAACFAEVNTAGMELSGKTNKSALSYKPGEEMVYTFTMNLNGQKADGLYLKWVRQGDDGRVQSGKGPADKPLVVKTSLNKPGFVNVEVTLVDKDGKKLFYLEKNGKKSRWPIAYYAGTAVQAETLTDCGEPKDFDEFWAKQRKRLAAVPFKGKTEMTKVKENDAGVVYAVSVPCVAPRPATGYLSMPKNAKPKSLKITVGFQGYGHHIQRAPGGFCTDRIHFEMNAHGQKLGQPDEYYKKFFASISNKKYSYGFNPEENKNPETAFFNGMTLRIIRALEFLKTLPEWDGKNIEVWGGSQGGLQTLWAAALDPAVSHIKPWVPWCCDLGGHANKDRLCGGWRIKWVPALDYYDPVFLAKRIKTCKVEITRAGLGDYCCPPSGIAVVYNNLATPNKSIKWVQGSEHGFVPKHSEIVTWSTMKK